jgi:hypothetical protein
MSPAAKRSAAQYLETAYSASERRVCRGRCLRAAVYAGRQPRLSMSGWPRISKPSRRAIPGGGTARSTPG